MSDQSITSLLLIEDDPSFARLLREMFKDQGSAETVVTHVDCMSAAETHLADRSFDIILLDPGLPEFTGNRLGQTGARSGAARAAGRADGPG